MSRADGRPAAWVLGRWRELLSVWATGRQDAADQLRDRGYVPGTEADIELIPPAVAAYAVTLYSRPGETVVDPDCGTGVVITEALRAGRHAVGLTSDSQCWRVARANLTDTKHAGVWTDAVVLDFSPNRTHAIRAAGLSRRADLILTTVRVTTSTDSPGPDSDLESWLRCRVRMWTSLLRPGGRAVITVPPYRSPDGALIDLPTAVLDAAVAGGLEPMDRYVALVAQLQSGQTLRNELTTHTRRVRSPIALVAHHTVLVLRAPHVDELSHPVVRMQNQVAPTKASA